MDYAYQGFYTRFDTASKDAGGLLMGADTLVGDVFSVDFRVDDAGSTTAWLVNRFGGDLGFVNAAAAYKLQVAAARGLKVQAILSFLAFTEEQQPSPYWGEVAIVCTPQNEPVFDEFVTSLGSAMAQGIRPNVDLGEPELKKIVESKGTWIPTEHIDMPKRNPGTAIVKSHRSITENMVEQGRKGNIGCYVVSIAFIVVVVVGVIYLLGRMFGLF